MLYTPHSHEPLVSQPWDPDVALTAIREIAADCEASFDSPYWPVHPRDDDGTGPYATLYEGPSGVIYALDLLARRGLVDTTRDYVPALEQLVEVYRAKPEIEEWNHPPSLLGGETGILLALYQLVPSSQTADRIAELVAANVDDRHHEFMWGSPGTMLAARAIDRPDLWRQSADHLLEAWEDSGLWTQDLYGRQEQYLGPVHGFAGCVLALAHEPSEELDRRASDTFRRFAVQEDGLANWPGLAGADLVTRQKDIRMQWCHGAPGMVASLAEIAPARRRTRAPVAGRRRARLARGPAHEGREPLPRHSRQRSRVSEAVSPNRRRALAWTRSSVCDACRCSGRARSTGARPRTLLAVDRRPRHRALSRALPGRQRDAARP